MVGYVRKIRVRNVVQCVGSYFCCTFQAKITAFSDTGSFTAIGGTSINNVHGIYSSTSTTANHHDWVIVFFRGFSDTYDPTERTVKYLQCTIMFLICSSPVGK